jgi:hypothetical protein
MTFLLGSKGIIIKLSAYFGRRVKSTLSVLRLLSKSTYTWTSCEELETCTLPFSVTTIIELDLE